MRGNKECGEGNKELGEGWGLDFEGVRWGWGVFFIEQREKERKRRGLF